MTPEEKAEKMEEYARQAHRVQSGIAYLSDKTDQQPKHLRVGLNLRAAEHGGLVELLIAKGLITEVEYWDAMIKGVADEAERLRYELRNSSAYPSKVSTWRKPRVQHQRSKGQ